MQARRQAPADSPFAGLLPAASADGEFLWDGKHHIVGYDLWNLRGLLCTADAARDARARPTRPTSCAKRGRRVSRGDRRGLEADRRWPTSRRVGRRTARTGATPKRSGPPSCSPSTIPRVAATIDHVRQRARRRVHRRHDPVAGHARTRSIPYMSAYTTMAVAGPRRARAGGRGFLLVSAALDGRARVPRRHLLQAAVRLERHDPARDRRVELRHHAAAHAGPRAGRRTAPARGRARRVAGRRPGDLA